MNPRRTQRRQKETVSELEVGRGKVGLYLPCKVTSYILGNRTKLYHQSQGPSSSLGESMSRDHLICPLPAWDGRTWERWDKKALGLLQCKALVGLWSDEEGRGALSLAYFPPDVPGCHPGHCPLPGHIPH